MCTLLRKLIHWFVWLGGVAVGRRIRDQEVSSSILGCSAARCNSGQVVHTHVPLFTKQYKLVPASAGGKQSNRHTARCTSPVSVVWQRKLVSG